VFSSLKSDFNQLLEGGTIYRLKKQQKIVDFSRVFQPVQGFDKEFSKAILI